MASPEVIVTAITDYGYCRSVSGDDHSSIKKGRCYYLVEKHSSDWWIIKSPEFEDDVYVPASYVKEIGEGLSPQTIAENDDNAFENDNENHNEGESHYANLAAIQSHIHGNMDDDPPHYYNLQNIKDALKKPPPKPSPDDKPSDSLGDNWLVYIDRSCDRKYYHNTKSGESTWKPPRGVRNKIPMQVEKRASMPVVNIIPDGWQEHSSDGETYYVHDVSGDKWFKSESDDGRVYYYHAVGGESAWHLPLIPSTPRRHLSIDSSASVVAELKQHMERMPRIRLSSTAEDMSMSLSDSALKHLDASSSEDLPSLPSSKPLPPLPPNLPVKTNPESDNGQTSPATVEPVNFNTVFEGGVEKMRGFLNKKKVVENNRKINFRKNWSPSYVVLSELLLIFYKDEKASLTKPHGKPEFMLDLTSAVINRSAKGEVVKVGAKSEIKSSKKNVILVMTIEGNGYFLQSDNDEQIHKWFTVLSNNVTLLSKQPTTRASHGSLGSLDSELGLDDFTPSPGLGRRETKRGRSTDRQILDDPNIPMTEKKGIVNEILRMLIPRRPDVATLQDKGIIKDAVFGCQSITKLCSKEKSTIPKFLEECMAAIEHKGLDADGIYRISGNLATIQKLRFMVDQEEQYDLFSPEMDVNVLTGALKLFFRELKEPLIPFNQYDAFVQAISQQSRDLKVRAIGDQIKKLPKANRETMKRLFQHLTNVVEKSKENRMQVQNVAIVFGPTLMWPEVEKGNVAVSMVYQNQVVECVLQNYSLYF